MNSHKSNIVDGNIYAYLLIDYNTKEILDGNKLSRTFYQISGQYPQIETLFQPTLEGESLNAVVDNLMNHGTSTLNHVRSIKATGEEFPCHVELCRVTENQLLVVIKENCQVQDSQI